jgi:zinc metalloprotease ZmpB
MRAYKGIGGGATDAGTRRLASRHVCFLKIHADARLGPSPIVSSTDPRTYVTALQNADIANTSPDGIPGGTLGKVFRWAFEMQGLYQASGAPTPVTTIGQPPAVDVYIDDGRGGQYGYIGDFWDNTEVWNRRAADGGTTHEEPINRRPNYAYVRIRNRGTTTATGVIARGYHAQPSVGLTWPDDWSPMTTPQLTAPDIPPGGVAVVGPFTWVPTELGHECMLMEVSCPGDRSNIDVVGALPCAFGPTPHWRLIPFDNNLAQRNVAPVAAGGGATGLARSLSNRPFFVKNPYETSIRITLSPELPPFLVERGWKLRWDSPSLFTLGPRASRQVQFSLDPGKDFTADEVRVAGADLRVKVRSLMDGAIIGGMSYALDPDLKRADGGRPPRKHRRLSDVFKDIDLCSLGHREIESIEVTHIILEIALEKPCERDDEDE